MRVSVLIHLDSVYLFVYLSDFQNLAQPILILFSLSS
jgi:hypothetical protein